MARIPKNEIREPREKRNHCPKCTYYLDGKQVMNEDFKTGALSLAFFPIPGMHFRQKSTGTIYDRIGYATPCICETGNEISAGYAKDHAYHGDKPRESEPELVRAIIENIKPHFMGSVPMPLEKMAKEIRGTA